MASNATGGRSWLGIAGCFEVAGEAGIRVHRKMALRIHSRVATRAPQLWAAAGGTEVFLMAKKECPADVQTLPEDIHGMAPAL